LIRRLTAPLLLALLCACTPADPQPRATPGTPTAAPVVVPTASPTSRDTTLRWAIGEPSTILPGDATTPDELLVVDALYDSLTTWDDQLVVRPAAALRWEPRHHGRVWRFYLRPSARFHDGTPVTAGHFRLAWDLTARDGRAHHHLQDVAGYAAVRAGRATSLAGLRVVDGTTLDVHLTRPVADFPTVVAHPALAPLRSGFDDTRRPIGNGPFRMAEAWADGRFVRLRRAAATATRPGIGEPLDEIVFRFQDETSAYIAYEQERLDVSPVPAEALSHDRAVISRTQRYDGPGVLRGALPTTYFLWFNNGIAPFDDVRARRGISLALDRGRLADEVFDNSASPAAELVGPVVPGGRRRTCSDCVHRPDLAKELLRSGGVRRVALWVNRGGDHEDVADRVVADLAAVGVRVDVRRVSFRRFLTALRDGEPGLFRFGWTLDYPTLSNVVRPLFRSDALPATGGLNFGRYRSRRVDRLLARADRTVRQRTRNELLRQAEDVVLGRDQAIIPLLRLRRRTVVADRVLQLHYGPFGTADLSRVRVVRRVTSSPP
jgi:ABC-type transport system substrate-binding protein